MQKSFIVLGAALSLSLGGCIRVNNNTTNNAADPDGAGADGQTGDDAADGSGTGAPSRGRASASTKGGSGAKPKRVAPSTKPVDPDAGDKPKRAPLPTGGTLSLTGFIPTVAAPGAQVEIFGSGFGADIAKVSVTVAGVSWAVADLQADRVVATVPDNAASGTITVAVGKKKKTTEGTISVVADGGFGPPTDADKGLVGEVFTLAAGTDKLPDFSTLGAPHAIIAVGNLDVPTRSFTQGFPGVSGDLLEWFAIRFSGVLNVTSEAEYSLCLNSDDGSQLWLEDTLVIDNDGLHPTKEVCEIVYLEPGGYRMNVLYFQGPATEIALQLKWGADGATPAAIPTGNLLRPQDEATLARGGRR